MLNAMYALNYTLEMIQELAPVNPTGASTHQELNFGKLLEPKFRKLFYETYDEMPEQFSNIFHMNTSKKAVETDYGMGAMPAWTEFGSSTAAVASDATAMPTVPYALIPAGLERYYKHKEFAKGFMVERKFVDDEQYSVIEKMPKDLARAGRYKVESDAASLFNTGFAYDATKHYDTKALFAADHPLLGGGSYSNLMTGPLSDTNLKLATNLMRRTVDEANKQIQFKPDTLIVSPELEWLAMELIKSARKTGTGDNDINSLMGRFKIEVWDFLTDTDSWYICDSKRHQLNFFWRVKPEFKREEDFDSLVSKYRGYMRYSYGYSDWRGIIGSQG